jgi:hypothetical protein
VRDWQRRDDQTEHNIDWVGTGSATFLLVDGCLLTFSFRKAPEHFDDFMRISIEDVLPWRTESKWPLPPRLPLGFARDEGGYQITRKIMTAVKKVRLDAWNGNDIPPATGQAHQDLLARFKELTTNDEPDFDEEAYDFGEDLNEEDGEACHAADDGQSPLPGR